MIVRSLEVANFRRFREPLRLDGFTPGFNVVVEPNETGKSTLLEALRAALFTRHSSKNDLVRSYVPLGDDVAPRVAMEFTIADQAWTLEKQFLRSPFVRLSGPHGRRESDAAEEALQELLGFERGNNRSSDLETRGPLGMLWVEQATAFSVDAPNRIVRDTVRGVLEAEVGAVTGGRRFDSVRANVETAYSALRTGRTGQSRGGLLDAETRLGAATASRLAAEGALRGYEQALTELEDARNSLRIVERDLADPATTEERRRLEEDLKIAETAALRLSAADAHHGRAEEVARTAAARIAALDAAEERLTAARADVVAKQSAHDEARAIADSDAADERRLRGELDAARSRVAQADAALAEARRYARASAEAAGRRRAIEARNALRILEDRARALQGDAESAIATPVLAGLAKLHQAAIEARIRFEAGTVKVDIELAEGTTLSVDGVATDAATIDVLAATRLTLGAAGSVVIRPPAGASRSSEADLAAAEQALAAALRESRVSSHSEAVARTERAASARREIDALQTQISATCPGDPTIGLSPGADALRGFVAALSDQTPEPERAEQDLGALEAVLAGARTIEAEILGRHEEGRAALAKAESDLATAVAELGSATREQTAAGSQLAEVLRVGDRASLEDAHRASLRDLATKMETLETARESARSFNGEALSKRIANIERATRRAGEERVDLTRRIALLEASVMREGTTGPAGTAAAARDEEEAAADACERLRREADVLEMLRNTLKDAADEASRTFLAPVTRRASGYIERLLPGCAPTFDEGLGLASVKRSGADERCGDLSRGTQEQLAILTRLAFADLLLDNGAPISLILDDPLVYSDDARLETMTEILQEAAKRMQVILLTCRSKAFRHVDANRIVLR